MIYSLLQQGCTRLRKDERGQDLIEHALMAGFVAAAAS